MSNIRIQDRVKQAEEYARKNKGKLPRMKVLNTLDSGLVQSIYRRPDAFRHIPREFTRRPNQSTSDYIAVAEKLAAENGGFLPRFSDIARLDPSLANYIRRKPELFAHLPEARYTKRKEKALAKAVKRVEALAAKTGGKFANTKKFQTKYPTLKTFIQRNRDAFAHIPKFRVTKPIEEHVADAEKLAENNGGKLPPVSVLKRDYGSLRSAMLREPERFTHLSSESLVTRIEEYVKVAKALAKGHKGILPSASWLLINGYNNLVQTLYRRPEEFKGIKHEICDGTGRRIEIRVY